MKSIFKYFIGILTLLTLCCAYKPVVLFHGILSDVGSMEIIAEQIKLVHHKKFFV
jgi:hypothetical protein